MKHWFVIAGVAACCAAAWGSGPLTAVHAQSSDTNVRVVDFALNRSLAGAGANYALAYAEYVTSEDSPQQAGIIIAKNVGNKQLGAHFVPGDPRRGGFLDIAYITDRSEGAANGGLTKAQTTGEINRAMAHWDAQACSAGLSITNLGAHNFDFGVVQNFLGFGGSPFYFADITHAGWLPRTFFDKLTPTAETVLGVTVTLVFGPFVGPYFFPSDIDGNGKADVAFREIYYNDGFAWRSGPWTGGDNLDAFSVILHESGHGLGQGHFGNVSINPAGKLLFSPDAVMNAVVSRRFARTGLLGTDQGGHCSIWASYPNH